MTQLQLEFNKLREQERANRMNEAIKQQEANVKSQEAGIKQAQLDLNQIEVELKQLKAPAEISNLLSQANLNDANTQKSLAQINEVLANVELIKGKTGLTQVEIEREQIALTNDIMSLLHRMTGINYPGDIEDTISSWIGSAVGGVGKTIVGSLIG